MLAPYNFLNYGAPTGWFGFDLSLLGSKTLGIGTFYMICCFINYFYWFRYFIFKIKENKERFILIFVRIIKRL